MEGSLISMSTTTQLRLWATALGVVTAWACPVPGQENTPSDDTLPPGALARLGSPRFRVPGAMFGARFVDGGKKMLVRIQGDPSSGRREDTGTFRLLNAKDGQELSRFEFELNSVLGIQSHSGITKSSLRYSTWCLSPDGALLASSQRDGSSPLQVRELTTQKSVWEITEKKSDFVFVQFSPDGKRLAAVIRRRAEFANEDSGPSVVIRLWDVSSRKEIGTLPLPPGPNDVFQAHWFTFSPDGTYLAATGFEASNTASVRVWDVTANKPSWRLEGEEDKPDQGRPLAFAPDSKALAAVHKGKITLWDPATGKRIKDVADYSARCAALDFSPNGKRLITVASVADFDRVRLWDPSTGQEIPLPIQSAKGYVFADSSDTLVLGDTAEAGLVICEGVTGKLRRKVPVGTPHTPGEGVEHAFYKARQGMGWPFALSPDGKTLIACDQAGQIRRFEVATGKEIPAPGLLSDPATVLAYSPDGKKLLAAGLGRVLLHDVAGKTAPLELVAPALTMVNQNGPTPKARPTALAFSSDSRRVAAGWDVGTVSVWDAASGKLLWQAREHPGRVFSLDFAPDDRTLISTGTTDAGVVWWDAGTGRPQRLLSRDKVKDFPAQSWLVLGPHALTVFARGNDRLQEWEMASGKFRRALPWLGDSLAFSADGRFLLADGASTFHLMDLVTSEERRSFAFADHGRVARNAAGLARFSPDGHIIAGIAGQGVVRLWERDTATLLAMLDGHEGGVFSLAFAPDGLSLATCAGDGTILYWRVPSVSSKSAKAMPLEPKVMRTLWQQLVGDDTAAAGLALERLASAGGVTAWLADQPMPAGDVARLRVIELLDRIGTKEARAQLQPYADGPAGAWTTRAARAALKGSGVAAPLLSELVATKEADGTALPGGARARLGLLRFQQGAEVWGLRYSGDGTGILAGSTNYDMHNWSNMINLALWDRTTGSLHKLTHVADEGPWRSKGPQHIWKVSPDGKRLATCNIYTSHRGYLDPPLMVKDLATGEVVLEINDEDVSRVHHVQFSSDGNTLLTLSWAKLRLFDLTSGQELPVSAVEDGSMRFDDARISPDGQQFFVISLHGKNPGEIRCWRRGGGEPMRLRHRLDMRSGFGALVLAPDSKHMAVVSAAADDKPPRLLLVHLESGKVVQDFGEAIGPGSSLVFSPDGKQLVSWVAAKLRRWDVATGKELPPVEGTGNVTVEFTPDSKTMAVAEARVLRLHEATSGRERWRLPLDIVDLSPLRHQENDVHGVGGLFAFAPDSKTLAVAARRSIRQFDVATGQEIGPTPDRQTLHAVAVGRGGQRVAAVSSKEIQVWDVAAGTVILRAPAWPGPDKEPVALTTVALSPDGKRLAAGASDGTVTLFDVQTAKRVGPLRFHEAAVTSLLFLADGDTLVSADLQFGAAWWDAATGAAVAKSKVPGPTAAVSNRFPGGASYWHDVLERQDFFTLRGLSAFLSPDGRQLLAPSADAVAFYELASSQARAPKLLRPRKGKFVVSGDGQLVVEGPDWEQWYFGDFDGPLRLLDAATGAEKRVVANMPRIRDFALSPDGKLLAACSTDGVRLWDTATGTLQAECGGHRGVVTTIVFSPDGAALVSAAYDGTLLVWEVAALTSRPAAKGLAAGELQSLWEDLAAANPASAAKAMQRLAGQPQQAGPFLRDRLRAATAPTAADIAKLVADLDDARPKTREAASAQLKQLAELAVPALQACLAGTPTLEQRRRVDLLLARLGEPLQDAAKLRALRAVELLQWLATPEAIEVLQRLAAGADGAYETREARAALRRIK
jgi:WD40 repeat protein